ncbi:hypothetical protein Nepgr_007828 [Nepenthes gracilis]|uniref:Uncharacterized protein n=1 Tax=Nepenthes gracilis TaxID=150966 RepID=A0AAD3S7K0_NEPGR|nr:hypothetical protein Nepgr_007828 [Nepenthes gracilis]
MPLKSVSTGCQIPLAPADSVRVGKGSWKAKSKSHSEVISAGPVPESNSFAALQSPEADTHLDPSAGVYVHHSAEAEAHTLAESITSDAGVSHEAVALLEGTRAAGSLPGPLEVLPDSHASGPIEVVDPDITPESISRIVQKYSLDGSPADLAWTSTMNKKATLDG